MKVTVRGGPETARALRELGRASAAETALRRALRPGADEIVAAAKAAAPVRTGALRRSISSGIGKSGRFIGRLVVGHRGPPARYSHLVEFGTRHARAQPYMRNALQTKAATVVQLFGRDIWVHITQQATRLAARTGVRGRR
jgi:HK97 gp10 family phage protein